MKYIKLEGDKTIWTIVFALLTVSVLVVYSVEDLSATTSHIRNIFIGILTMYMVHKLKFKYFSKLSVVTVLISVVLLIVVILIGSEINGAKRWLNIGGGLSFQPSDLAKISILVLMCRQISKFRDYLHDWKGFIWYLFGPLVIVCLLILPSNFSTSSLVFFNGFFLMILAKIHYKFLLSIVGVVLFMGAIGYLGGKYVPLVQKTVPRSVTWISRIDNFISPSENHHKDEGYQINESKIAIKNGGLLGKGPGKGVQRHFLYAGSSDFVYALTIEQYGIVFGGLLPMFLYLLFFYKSIIISRRTESVFGSLTVASLSFALVFQAAVNMAVNVGLFPVTGQTLPLISKGGTSIIFTCIAIGIILSISKNTEDRDYEKA
ncbi:MAG: FtsW/RodA/SpoVE family cell cycle protein [Flavobacteriales bacterium]